MTQQTLYSLILFVLIVDVISSVASLWIFIGHDNNVFMSFNQLMLLIKPFLIWEAHWLSDLKRHIWLHLFPDMNSSSAYKQLPLKLLQAKQQYDGYVLLWSGEPRGNQHHLRSLLQLTSNHNLVCSYQMSVRPLRRIFRWMPSAAPVTHCGHLLTPTAFSPDI